MAGLDIRFRRPARIDDELLVISRVAELRAASVLVHQRVMRGDEVVTEADVNVAFLGQDGRPRRQPAEWRAIFGSLTGVE